MAADISPIKVLFIDDEAALWLPYLGPGLASHGLELTSDEVPENALKLIKDRRPDAVLLDIWFGNEDKGKATLAKIKQRHPGMPVVIVTATLAEMKFISSREFPGASYFFSKEELDKTKYADPYAELAAQIKKAILEVKRSNVPWDSRLGFIVGKSQKMIEVAHQITQVSSSDTTVLLMGESGTGKELVAGAIHKLSSRHNQHFEAVHCGALADTILESELFGHEKGAFSGADRLHQGIFERAKGGSVFLDEVQTMSPGLQVKLLRVLQEKTIRRVGGKEKLAVDVRVISASNEDLEAKVNAGTFREDLYYRLNSIKIVVPPLRDRLEDIPALYEHFIRKHNGRLKKQISAALREDLLRLFQQYPWPGNIRQFENAIEGAMVKTQSNVLISEYFSDVEASGPEQYTNGEREIDRAAAKERLRVVYSALVRSNWEKGKASKELGFTYHQGVTRTVVQVLTRFPDLASEFPDLVEAFPKLKKYL